MGYRSELVIAVPKWVRTECMLNKSWPSLLSDSEPTKEHNDIQFWEIDGVKWYTGMFTDVDELDEFFDKYSMGDGSEEDNDKEFVAAIRLGENFGDTEEWGDPSDYDIFTQQTISY